MYNVEEGTYQRQDSLFEVENVSDVDKAEIDHIWDTSKLCVELTRGADGFGLNLDGGTNKPLYTEDKGIFIVGIRKGSNADKLGCLEPGDKILEVNGQLLHNRTHEQVVELFKKGPKKARLVIHKKIGQLLGPPPNLFPSGMESTASSRELKDFSPVGFVAGVAIGCIIVFAVRRYWMQR